jgi:hypothetical protein
MNVQTVSAFLAQHIEIIIAILSAIVAMFSAVAARAETGRQRRLLTESLRQNIDAASLDWGNLAIETLTRATMLTRTRHLQTNDLAFQSNKANLLIGLSVLIERGRMFFPNLDVTSKGAEKDSAYRGHRPPILDALMWAYHEVDALAREGGPTSADSAHFIDECRRLLVSELQAHLDPRRKDEIIGRYDDQTHENRKVAIHRAKALKARLAERRPGIALDQPHPGAEAEMRG